MPELVKDEFGNLVYAQDDALGGATQFRKASELDKVKLEQKRKPKTLADYVQGGLLDPYQAAQLGFASGVTGGASDVLISGDEESRLKAKALREENPFSTMGGEVASVFLPFGAAGAAAKVGEAVRAGGKGLGVLGSVLNRGGAAALEGGLFGAQQGITASALDGDPELNGEKFLQHVSLGAALGGVIGGGEGLMVGAANKAKRSLGSLVDDMKPREMTPEMASKMADDKSLNPVAEAYSKLQPGAARKDIADISNAAAGKGSAASQERGARILGFTDDATRNAAMDARAVSLGGSADELLRANDNFEGLLRNFDRNKEIRGVQIDRSAFTSGRGELVRDFERIDDLLDVARADRMNAGHNFNGASRRIDEIGESVFGPRVRNADGVYERSFTNGKVWDSPEEAYSALDRLRKELDDRIKASGADVHGAPYRGALENARDDVGRMLENPAYWGEKAVKAHASLASAERAVDDSLKNMKKYFLQKEARDGAEILVPNMNKISGVVRNADDPATVQAMEYMGKYIEAIENRAKLVKEHLAPTASTAEALERMQAAHAAMKDTYSLALRDLEEFAAAKSMKAGAGNYGLSWVGYGVASALGAPGIFGAAAVDIASRYPMYAKRFYNIRKAIEESDNRILRGVKNLFKSTKSKGDLAEVGEGISAAARATSRKPSLYGRTRVAAATKLADQYHAAVEALAQTDDELQKNVEMSMGDIAQVQPEVAGVASGRAVAAAAYLRSQIPYIEPDLLPMNPAWGNRPTPSQAQMRAFMDKVNAVSDPVGVLEDAKRGAITREMADAMREVYPRLYQDIQQKIMTVAMESKNPPPYSSRLAMSILFDVPATPTMQPTYVLYQQETYALMAAPAPPPAASNMSKTGVNETFAPMVESTSSRLMGPLDDRK